MSRIGKQPVAIPGGVEVHIGADAMEVKGPKGQLAQRMVPEVRVEVDEQSKTARVERTGESKRHRSMHGLYQRLLSNMVKGVVDGYEKRLKVQGTGYRAELRGRDLVLQVGFANEVVVPAPDGVEFEVPKAASREEMDVFVRGIDKQMVGEVAARVRRVRPCDPYKAKGVRYADEQIRRLEGKTFGG